MKKKSPVSVEALKEDYQYTYPNGLQLKPGTPLHDKLITQIVDYANSSRQVMSARYGAWNNTDEVLTGFKWVDDDEKKTQDKDKRKPVSIVFPYSYAILESLMSYMISAFFQDPVFRYVGYSPDDIVGAILLEKVVALHCHKFRVLLNVHTMLRDAFVYGIGVVAPIWKESRNFGGNALLNIDPYKLLPDPNVPIHDFQDGEFIGWVDHESYNSLLMSERNNEDIFNVKYVKHIAGDSNSDLAVDNSARSTKTGLSTEGVTRPIEASKTTHTISMYIRLIPEDWELGDSEYPELWYFKIAGDQIVIEARPAGFDHDKYPLAIAVPEYDGYSTCPVSRIEILSGLQHVLDFEFNSHIANVRKLINGSYVYDPWQINGDDLNDPEPGKMIRTRRPVWGKGLQDSIKQLEYKDYSANNMADASYIMQHMQKVSAMDEYQMGSLRSGGPERLTKAEYQGTAQGAFGRLERLAQIIGMQAMRDVGELFAYHTQQMMDEEMFINVTGKWREQIISEYGMDVQQDRLAVQPTDLDVRFDLLVHDGSIPGGNYSQVWEDLFKVIVEHPGLSQKFDMVRIFKHIARNNGAKDVEYFIKTGGQVNPELMSEEAVMKQKAMGNLMPIGG
jgi:hypothetical protein